MAVARRVSQLLNNTPGVARKDYIDPRILNPESYARLWKLCQTQFPSLIARVQNSTSPESSFDQKYNPDFEALASEFLEEIEN